MSFDPFDKDDLTPEWGDMDLGWMNVAGEPEPERPVQRRRPEPEPERPVQRRRPEPEPERPAQRRRPEPEPKRPVQRRRPEPRPEQPVQRRPAPSGELPGYDREPAYLRKKRSGGRRGISPTTILIVLLIGGMIFAGWKLAGMFSSYHRDRSAYDELASRAISGLAEAEATAAPDMSTSLNDIVDATAPEIVSQVPIQVDWEYLKSVNSDIVGWLYCPDTIVDYPVLQTTDNSYYLTHGADNAYRAAGALFADCGSVLGVELSNYIIYGHNMKDASMFGSYRNYSKESYYDEHPTMYLLTPTQNYRIDLMCCHTVEATLDNFPTYFGTTGDLQSYLNRVTSSSYWVNYDAVTTDYQLLTMSTCTGNADYRLLLQGIMVPIQ